MVARVIVERPVALGARFQAGPGPVLLCREHDRDQPPDSVVQPVRVGGEQLEPTRLISPGTQVCRANGVVECLGDLRSEWEPRVDQQERAQRLAQVPGTREILIGKRRPGRYEPVLNQPRSEAWRVLDFVCAWQDVQGIHEVADELQVPRSRQAAVIPIGGHECILSRPPDHPRPEGRRQDEEAGRPSAKGRLDRLAKPPTSTGPTKEPR
jgi:hypothetical protein